MQIVHDYYIRKNCKRWLFLYVFSDSWLNTQLKMPYRKCSFCNQNNKVNTSVSYFKLTKHILLELGLPDNYGDFICSDHFQSSDVSNGKLLPTSVPNFLHRKSTTELDHDYHNHAKSPVLGNIFIFFPSYGSGCSFGQVTGNICREISICPNTIYNHWYELRWFRFWWEWDQQGWGD